MIPDQWKFKKSWHGKDREIIAWAMYDWANSGFATVVMAGFFPVFFKEYWSAAQNTVETTFRLGVANSTSCLIMLIFAPFLGGIADKAQAKKGLLFIFAIIGIAGTSGLYFVMKGDWLSAVVLYIISTIGFMGGNIFYDAMILIVSEERALDLVSALGFALGYLGGGILLALCILMTLWPQHFWLKDPAEAVRFSFLLTALWWAIFSIPLFIYVKERSTGPRAEIIMAVSAGIKEVATTCREIRDLKNAFIFLVAYWFYIDGVGTIIRMAVDYGMSIGFSAGGLILALLITQIVGFPASIAFGKIGTKMGAKTGILIGLIGYMLVTIFGAAMTRVWEFYAMAIAIGIIQGGVQLLSRSLYARLIPAERSAQFFGLYNMLGKFAAIIGPFMVGWVGVKTGSHRMGILSLLALFVFGAALLLPVKEERNGRKL